MVFMFVIKAASCSTDTNAVMMHPNDIAMHQFEQIRIYKSDKKWHRCNVVPSDSIPRGRIGLSDHVRQINRFHLGNVYDVQRYPSSTSIEKPVADASKIGILGQDKAIDEIMWSIFEPRKLSLKTRLELDLQVVRGVVLYGPPGTGKTSMIRGVCNYMGIVPTVIHGPEILNEYIGKSEENIRQLFLKPMADQIKFGDESPLHIIILDEMDAICSERSSSTNGTNTKNTVVNQLLSMMDGYTQMDNYVIFGTTNRLDMIEPALLRSGRFELKIKIDVPDANGRFELLKFFTKPLQVNGRLASDVSESVLAQIAETTPNYTGAELKQLVQSASRLAIRRVVMSSKTAVHGKPNVDETKIVVRLSDIGGACQMLNQQQCHLVKNKEIGGPN